MKVTPDYSANPFWPTLGEGFFDAVQPAAFPKAVLRFRNQDWAERLGLGDLSVDEWQKAFWAFEPLPENLPNPLALRYHGHQFMHYNPDLGDGRGFLYAQIKDPKTGKNLDLGTKGSGQTPWSRRGDGRLTLKGAMREALATEFLEALGVNTSKTFSIFETGEHLERGDEPSPTRSAVLVRLSHGHVRFGTFQRLAYLKDKSGLEKLFQFCLKYYYPQLDPASPKVFENFFSAVASNVAKTTARWMLGGFVHGVLNTDNINITGESFDYGPYRFLPHYDIHFTAAYFDQSGLYAYGQQPRILMWNLDQLRGCLEMIAPPDTDFNKGLEMYQAAFSTETFSYFLKRMNITDGSSPGDISAATEKLFLSSIAFLEKSKVPFQAFFFDWNGGATRTEHALKSDRKDFYQGPEFEAFLNALKAFKPQDESIFQNSYFLEEGPVHLHIDEIERIWEKISTTDDWSEFNKKILAIQRYKTIFKSLLSFT